MHFIAPSFLLCFTKTDKPPLWFMKMSFHLFVKSDFESNLGEICLQVWSGRAMPGPFQWTSFINFQPTVMWNCAEMGFHIEHIFYPGNREKREIVKKLQWKGTFSSSLSNATFLRYSEYVTQSKDFQTWVSAIHKIYSSLKLKQQGRNFLTIHDLWTSSTETRLDCFLHNR